MTFCEQYSQFETPLVLVDIGSKGGVDPRWKAIQNMEVHCFDPAGDGHDAYISGQTGKRTLYHTKLPLSTGFYKTNMAFFGRLLNSKNGEVVREEEVDTLSFEDARKKFNIPPPDFIKLDVEGAELDILRGANLSETFGILTEVRFHKEINGCPTFSDIDRFLTSKGFMLYKLWTGSQSRKDKPYPTTPFLYEGEAFYGATDGGQVMDGDALYLRDPMRLKLDHQQLIKILCMLEVWDLMDCAEEIHLRGVI